MQQSRRRYDAQSLTHRPLSLLAATSAYCLVTAAADADPQGLSSDIIGQWAWRCSIGNQAC